MHHIPESLQVWAAHERSISSSSGSHTLSVPECIVHYQCSAVGRPCLAALEARCTITVNTWLLRYKEKKLCIRSCFTCSLNNMQTVQTDRLRWHLICSDAIMESRAELRCRSDLLAKCHWISLYPTSWHWKNWKMECRQTGDELCLFYDWHSPLRSSWESSIFISVTEALWPAGVWMNLSFCLHTNCSLTHLEPFFCCLLASHSPLCPLIFYSNLNSRSANTEGFAWSSLWAPFSLKCLDLQWHEKSAGDADGNLSCPLNTASPLGHAT